MKRLNSLKKEKETFTEQNRYLEQLGKEQVIMPQKAILTSGASPRKSTKTGLKKTQNTHLKNQRKLLQRLIKELQKE